MNDSLYVNYLTTQFQKFKMYKVDKDLRGGGHDQFESIISTFARRN
jgi:hypothetical protein